MPKLTHIVLFRRTKSLVWSQAELLKLIVVLSRAVATTDAEQQKPLDQTSESSLAVAGTSDTAVTLSIFLSSGLLVAYSASSPVFIEIPPPPLVSTRTE